MRETKFRGMRLDGKGWAYGSYFKNPLRYGYESMIYVQSNSEDTNDEGWIKVKHETVCQYTGVKDKNGKEIYDGHVLGLKDKTYQVVYDKGCFWALSKSNTHYIYHLYDCEQMEIIGNIYENPELLNETK